jgi:FkbM family methyltransferase
MQKIIKKIIHKLINKLNYRIVNNEDLINFKLDDFKKSLETTDLDNIYKNENLVSFISKNFSKSHSQIFQDLFVHYILKKEKGIYCEVGALDGKELSNTLYLEKEHGWSGILCEPNKSYQELIKKNRPNNILITEPLFFMENKEINFTELEGGRSGMDKSSYGEKSYKLKTTTLNKVLKENLSNKKINYLSIDTEGTEYEIIKGLDFNEFYPEIITIEHNYDKEKRDQIYDLLKKQNYNRYFKSISRFEDWYIRPLSN